MRLATILTFVTSIGFTQPFDGYVPPGTIHISGNLFIDATEVSNLYWREFEYYANQSQNPLYMPFAELRQEVTEKYRPNYYQNAEYRYFPVVGVTRAQAVRFCKWRTQVINAKLREMYDHGALTKLFEVRYRLPSEQEWELAASQIDTIQFAPPGHYRVEEFVENKNELGIKILLKTDTLNLRKVKKLLKEHKKNDSVPIFKVHYPRPAFAVLEDQLPANAYFPLWDGYDLFNPDLEKPLNIIGNVAELVDEPGIVKGGSWRHNLAVSFPSKSIDIEPNTAYDWVGFRCLCEVWEIR